MSARKSAIGGVTRAILDLLEVQTQLEVWAHAGKSLTPADATAMAAKLEGARNLLQRTILAATLILDEGATS